MAATIVDVQKQLAVLSERVAKMDKLLSKVSSKTGQVSSKQAQSRSPPPQSRNREQSKPKGNKKKPQGENRGRQDFKKGREKSGSRSTSQKSKKRKKTPLSKLPENLLEPQEREAFKESIKRIREKGRKPEAEWKTLTPEQKALNKLSTKLQVEDIVAKRSWLIIERAEKAAKKDGMQVESQ